MMEIKASCKFDYESIKALTHLSMFRKANPAKRMALWNITGAILLIIIVLEIILLDADIDANLVFFLFLGVMMLGLGAYIYFIVPKIRFKSMAKLRGAENAYLFCDDVLKVFTKSAEYNGGVEIEYSLLVRVYETTKYLFLYQTNNQVLIVDTKTITGGTVEEIRGKLSTYLGKKYIICNY